MAEKSKPCPYFKAGNCNRGKGCNFAHINCKAFLANSCKYGDACHFAHRKPDGKQNKPPNNGQKPHPKSAAGAPGPAGGWSPRKSANYSAKRTSTATSESSEHDNGDLLLNLLGAFFEGVSSAIVKNGENSNNDAQLKAIQDIAARRAPVEQQAANSPRKKSGKLERK